ncbi:hypothetical protein E4U21_006290 [Claviceps maximensis]|nr:hypothetical protein E4U21_006290 [Claviceps maximensis]
MTVVRLQLQTGAKRTNGCTYSCYICKAQKWTTFLHMMHNDTGLQLNFWNHPPHVTGDLFGHLDRRGGDAGNEVTEMAMFLQRDYRHGV